MIAARNHKADIIGPGLGQSFGDDVRSVIMLLDIAQNFLPRFFSDPSFAGDRTGNGRFGYPELFGKIADREIFIVCHLCFLHKSNILCL